MTNPLDPDYADELASAILDGEATAEELAIAEAHPQVMAIVEELRAISAHIPPTEAVDEFTKARQIRTAMADFDATSLLTPLPDPGPAHSGPADVGKPEVIDLTERSQSGGVPRWLAVAAGVLVALGGLGFAISMINDGADDSFAAGDSATESEGADVAAAPESTQASAMESDMDMAQDFEEAEMADESADADFDDQFEDSDSDASDSDASDSDASDSGATEAAEASTDDDADLFPSVPLTLDQTVLELVAGDDPSVIGAEQVADGSLAQPLDRSFCFTSGGYESALAAATLSGSPYLYLPVSRDGEPLELIVLDEGANEFSAILLTAECELADG